MHAQLQTILDWLNGELTPEVGAEWRQVLLADPELLAALLEEVRFDLRLSRCLADKKPAVDSSTAPVAFGGDVLPAVSADQRLRANQQRIWARIVAQAWADESYKARLLAEPAAVLREEGLALPADKSIRVVENTATQAYLVLPSLPPESATCAEYEERLAAGCSGCTCGCGSLCW